MSAPTTESAVTPETFRAQIAVIAAAIAARPLDDALDRWLNAEHGASSDTYRALKQSC